MVEKRKRGRPQKYPVKEEVVILTELVPEKGWVYLCKVNAEGHVMIVRRKRVEGEEKKKEETPKTAIPSSTIVKSEPTNSQTKEAGEQKEKK